MRVATFHLASLATLFLSFGLVRAFPDAEDVDSPDSADLSGLGVVPDAGVFAGKEAWEPAWVEVREDDEQLDPDGDENTLEARKLTPDCDKPKKDKHDYKHDKHKPARRPKHKPTHHKPTHHKPTHKSKHHSKSTTKHHHTKTSSVPVPSPTGVNYGAKCVTNNQCRTNATDAQAICQYQKCTFRCLNGTVKSGNECGLPVLHDPIAPGIDCTDGRFTPKGGSSIYHNPNNYSCTWDPANSGNYQFGIDPCFYQLVFGTVVLPNLFSECGVNPNDPTNQTNWVEQLAHWVDKDNSNVHCTAPASTGGTGCAYNLIAPSGEDNVQTFVAWAALTAYQRYYLYQSSQIVVLQQSFADFLGTSGSLGFSTIINAFQTDKPNFAVPPEPPSDGKLSLGLGIASTLLSIAGAAMPIFGLAEATAEAALKAIEVAHIVGESIGIGGEIFGNPNELAQTVTVTSSLDNIDAVSLTDFVTNSRDDLVNHMVSNIGVTYTNFQSAVNILSASGGPYNWFNRTDIPLWTKPNTYKDSFTSFLQAWGVSIVLSAKKIFIHAEAGCQGGVGNPNPSFYQGQWKSMIEGHCENIDDVYGTNPDPGQYSWYPVSYNGDPDFLYNYFRAGQPNGPMNQFSRNYFSAPNVAQFGLNWTTIFRSSYACHYGQHAPVTGFDASYPQLALDGIGGGVFSPSAIDPAQFPCFFNLPIASSDRSDQCNVCKDAGGRCCCGQQYFYQAPPLQGHSENMYYTFDNLGLDDYAAAELGRPTFGDAGRLGQPFSEQCCQFNYLQTAAIHTCNKPGCVGATNPDGKVCNNDGFYG